MTNEKVLPVVRLTVFLQGDEPTERELDIGQKLVDAGFTVFSDNIHYGDRAWFYKSFPQKTSIYFYSLEKRTVALDRDEMTANPNLVVYFNEDVKIEEYGSWRSLTRFIYHILMGEEISEEASEFGRLLILAQKTRAEEQEIKVIKSVEQPTDFDRSVYHLKTFPVPLRDAKFFELWKPHCDKPYTVMVKPYSQKGDLPFFSALFASSSWGVSRLDAEFLKHVWKDMGFVEEFDLDALIAKHVEECTPSDTNLVPMTEPVVHRATIDEVLQRLKERDEGLMRTKRMMDEELKSFKEQPDDTLY